MICKHRSLVAIKSATYTERPLALPLSWPGISVRIIKQIMQSIAEVRASRTMKNERPRRSTTIVAETAEPAPPGWADLQNSIAESSGVSLLLVDGHQPPPLSMANNNSICEP